MALATPRLMGGQRISASCGTAALTSTVGLGMAQSSPSFLVEGHYGRTIGSILLDF